jgi:hypothetical protein
MHLPLLISSRVAALADMTAAASLPRAVAFASDRSFRIESRRDAL